MAERHLSDAGRKALEEVENLRKIDLKELLTRESDEFYHHTKQKTAQEHMLRATKEIGKHPDTATARKKTNLASAEASRKKKDFKLVWYQNKCTYILGLALTLEEELRSLIRKMQDRLDGGRDSLRADTAPSVRHASSILAESYVVQNSAVRRGISMPKHMRDVRKEAQFQVDRKSPSQGDVTLSEGRKEKGEDANATQQAGSGEISANASPESIILQSPLMRGHGSLLDDELLKICSTDSSPANGILEKMPDDNWQLPGSIHAQSVDGFDYGCELSNPALETQSDLSIDSEHLPRYEYFDDIGNIW